MKPLNVKHIDFSYKGINFIKKEEKLRRLTATEKQSKSALRMPKLSTI